MKGLQKVGYWGLLALLWLGAAAAHDFGGVSTLEAPPEQPPGTCPARSTGSAPPPGFTSGSKGDPIWLYDGRLYLNYVDLEIGTVFPIRLVRRYDSRSEFDTALGYGWAFEHDRRLFEYPDGSVILRSGCGRRDKFVFTGGAYVAPRDGLQGDLTEFPDGSYAFRFADGKRDVFDGDGRLVAIENRTGQRHEFLYDPRGRLPLVGTSPRSVDPNVPMVVAYQPRLTRIQERGADGALTGYAVDFVYNESTGRLIRAVASDGRQIDYSHDVTAGATRGNLTQVAGLGDYQQTFTYADPLDPHNVSGLQDGVGAVTVSNTFDAQDRVTQQVWGGTTLQLSYPATGTTQVTETVTDGNGQPLQTRVSTLTFDEAGYLVKEVSPLGHELRHTYNASKDRIRTEVWENQGGTLSLLKATDYAYDGQARKLTERVTLDSGETVTTTWTYDHGWIASQETASTADPQVFRTEYEFVRDGQGVPVNLAAIKRRNDDGSYATTTYTYCSAAEAAAPDTTCPDTKLLKAADGPRTDVADVTTYTYYGSTDESGCDQATGLCHRRGGLQLLTNALGHTVEYLRYDRAGRVTQVQDGNGTRTEVTYHPRGWPLTRTVRGPDDGVTTDDAVTTYEYDPRGNVTRLTQPDGSYLEFDYDTRNRLTTVRDPDGGRIQYTLDSEGNRLKEETLDASNSLRRLLSRTVDQLNRPATVLGAQSQTTTFTYDAAGRQTTVTDPLSVEIHQAYDDLDRLIRAVGDAAAGGIQATTEFAYDAIGNLRQVTDPKGLATTYTYSAWGQLTQLSSPDTGLTTYQYDSAGNRTQQTDARGVTVTYRYDALNRLTGSEYSTASLNVTYAYDQPDTETGCTNSYPIGRLTRMMDVSGSTTYCYDSRGNLARKTQVTLNSPPLVTQYAYDLADHVSAITYPSGRVVTYGHDTQGRVDSVGVDAAPLLAGITYAPFGPPTQLDYGAGHVLDRPVDQDYRPAAIVSSLASGLQLHYGYDVASNLVSLADAPAPAAPLRTYGYDDLYRLTNVTDGSANTLFAYSYDATGNRQSKTLGTTTEAYSYQVDSHRLANVAGQARDYDAAGNTTSRGDGLAFEYDERNRLKLIKQGVTPILTNEYNGRGERVARSADAGVTLFVYNEQSQLLGEYSAAGNPIREYVWTDQIPVAVLEGGNSYPIEADHLGTPRAVIDPARSLAIWRWPLSGEPFGGEASNGDPDGDAIAYTQPLRFPGQVYDDESGLHYNYFRDYEPGTARYVESDPIGLQGGLSTYRYSYASPFAYVDPLGLEAQCRALFSMSGGTEVVLQGRDLINDSGWYLHRVSVDPPTDGRNQLGFRPNLSQGGGLGPLLGYQSGDCWGARTRTYRETYEKYQLIYVLEFCVEYSCERKEAYFRARTERNKVGSFDRTDQDTEFATNRMSGRILLFQCLEWIKTLK